MDSTDSHDLATCWSEYWERQGHQLVLDSWTEKYQSFIQSKNQDITGGETSNSDECEGKKFEEEKCETKSDWIKLWEKHVEEQYLFYYTWFSQWWHSALEASPTEEVNHTEDSEQENKIHQEDFALQLGVESLSIQANQTMDSSDPENSVKQQRDKTALEKTKDFLVELGFSSNLTSPLSNVDTCKAIAVIKKKKKKKKKKNVMKKYA